MSGDRRAPYDSGSGSLRLDRGRPSDVVRNNLGSLAVHTVFIRNLSPDVGNSELRTIAEEFGPTLHVFSIAARRGIGFVTFWDSRDAERCVAGLECRKIHDREVHTSYAYAAPEHAPQDAREMCATATVRLTDPNCVLDGSAVDRAFSELYGDLKSVERQEGTNAFTVKFYNLGGCRRAVQESGSVSINGERVLVEFNLRDDDGHRLAPRSEGMRWSRSIPPDGDKRFNQPSGYPPSFPPFGAFPPPPGRMWPGYGAPPPHLFPVPGPQFSGPFPPRHPALFLPGPMYQPPQWPPPPPPMSFGPQMGMVMPPPGLVPQQGIVFMSPGMVPPQPMALQPQMMPPNQLQPAPAISSGAAQPPAESGDDRLKQSIAQLTKFFE